MHRNSQQGQGLAEYVLVLVLVGVVLVIVSSFFVSWFYHGHTLSGLLFWAGSSLSSLAWFVVGIALFTVMIVDERVYRRTGRYWSDDNDVPTPWLFLIFGPAVAGLFLVAVAWVIQLLQPFGLS